MPDPEWRWFTSSDEKLSALPPERVEAAKAVIRENWDVLLDTDRILLYTLNGHIHAWVRLDVMDV